MRTFIYRCPWTGLNVQGWFANEAAANEDRTPTTYESVTCLACRRAHLINRATGKLLGRDNEKAVAAAGLHQHTRAAERLCDKSTFRPGCNRSAKS
jgi:hypothetical protein